MTEAVKRTETTPVHSAAKQALPDTEIEPLSSAVRTAVVGADGFVGGALAEALGGKRVVYGPACDEDVHVSRAENVIREADVVINAGGFRLRPGCARADYQRSHQGATSAIVPWVRKGALVVHVSSAAVLGKSRTHKLGSLTPPHPQSFPSAHYALAKIEADQYLEREAAERGFRVIFLRPATVYSPLGAGMVGTVLRLAKKGINLRLYPRGARHHLCHMDLLVEVARRVVERRQQLPHRSTFIIADPYTVTNRELTR